ncbi:MAG: PqqD family protein [Candidatus Omnitrophica bacterium]|nr:PqqD family protein [Candidatus Omnitrophota bacterium]
MDYLKEPKLIRNSKVAWQEIDDAIVVVTPWNKQIHIISETASMLWRALALPKSEKDLVTLIVQEYEIDEVRAEQDIRTFIKESIEKGIVDIKE